jgi:hypothetical protein
MLYIKQSRLKSLLDGWVDGWVDGWMEGKAGLRIAYSNQKLIFYKFKTNCPNLNSGVMSMKDAATQHSLVLCSALICEIVHFIGNINKYETSKVLVRSLKNTFYQIQMKHCSFWSNVGNLIDCGNNFPELFFKFIAQLMLFFSSFNLQMFQIS